MHTVTSHGQLQSKWRPKQSDVPVSSIEDILEIVSIFPVSEGPVQGRGVNQPELGEVRGGEAELLRGSEG